MKVMPKVLIVLPKVAMKVMPKVLSVHSVLKHGHESDGNSVHSDAKSAKTCQVDSEYTRKYNKLEITVGDFLAVTFGQDYFQQR